MSSGNLQFLLNENTVKYYWLGLLLADGHFSKGRCHFGLAWKDRKQVYKFAKLTKSGVRIKKIKLRGYNKTYKFCEIIISDKEIVDLLKKRFSIHDRKTYNPPDLSSVVEDNYIVSLFAGYVDGDGCISNVAKNKRFCNLKIQLHSSWLDILWWFRNNLSRIIDENLPDPFIDNAGYANWSIRSHPHLKKIKQKIVDLKLPILKRKWDKIDLNLINRDEQIEINHIKSRKLFKQGLNISRISIKLGLSMGSVLYAIKTDPTIHYCGRKEKWLKVHKKIKCLYNKGKTAIESAKILNTSREVVWRLYKKLNKNEN